MSKKDTLIELRRQIYGHLQAFIASLSEEERAVEGQPDNWGIKNALIHVALWDERMGSNLQAIAQGQPTTDYANYEEINAKDFEIHHQDTWEQVEAQIERSQQILVAGLEAIDEAYMSRTDLLPGGGERQTWNRIAGTCVTHPMLHISEYDVRRGQEERALELIIDISGSLAELDEGDEWQGLVIYNQACYYALAGHKTQAIHMLGQAFPLNPSLIEWSKQDSDLDSLREVPDYLELYPENPS